MSVSDFRQTVLLITASLVLITSAFAALVQKPPTAMAVQSPPVFDALAILQGKRTMTNEDIFQMMVTAKAGEDYPALAEIPVSSTFNCDAMKGPGFYADVDTKCQVIRRCDTAGNQWSFLCPNMTVFNQISLTCDWWFNVDCSQSIHFYDYSNSRLYQGKDIVLLDNQEIISVSQLVDDAKASLPKKKALKPAKSRHP